MRKVQKIALLLLSLSIYACAESGSAESNTKYLTFEDIRANPKIFDGKSVAIKGFIVADVLGATALYATSEDAENNKMFRAIDLISQTKALALKIKYRSPTCVFAIGKFRTYKSDEFRTDSLASDIGVVDLENVEMCPR
jgi:hypothetical protein